jgi:hypothetical protein
VTIKRLHVDQHAIRRNLRREPADFEPVLTVQNRGRSTKAFEVSFEGGGTMKQSQKPISCGARVWIETRGPVVVDGKVIT